MDGVAIRSADGDEMTRDSNARAEQILSLLDPGIQETLLPERRIYVVRNLLPHQESAIRGRGRERESRAAFLFQLPSSSYLLSR